MINLESFPYSKGIVDFFELSPEAGPALHRLALELDDFNLENAAQPYLVKRIRQGNLLFNFPREQYAKLDRGETPEAIDAKYLTLATVNYTNPAVTTVAGESLRVITSTRAVDPTNPKNSIFRFILDVGQFVGAWSSAILIGGSGATSTPGTGKIVAAVNNVKDDTNTPLNRDGTTYHLISWKIKHLDSSEV